MKQPIFTLIGILDAIFVFGVTLYTLITSTRTKEMNVAEWIVMILLLLLFSIALAFIAQNSWKHLLIVVLVSVFCKFMLADIIIGLSAAAIWVVETLWYILRVFLRFVR